MYNLIQQINERHWLIIQIDIEVIIKDCVNLQVINSILDYQLCILHMWAESACSVNRAKYFTSLNCETLSCQEWHHQFSSRSISPLGPWDGKRKGRGAERDAMEGGDWVAGERGFWGGLGKGGGGGGVRSRSSPGVLFTLIHSSVAGRVKNDKTRHWSRHRLLQKFFPTHLRLNSPFTHKSTFNVTNVGKSV